MGLEWVAVTIATTSSGRGGRGRAVAPMPHGSGVGSLKRCGSMRRHNMSPIVTPN